MDHFSSDFPIRTSIYTGFPVAMFDCRWVSHFEEQHARSFDLSSVDCQRMPCLDQVLGRWFLPTWMKRQLGSSSPPPPSSSSAAAAAAIISHHQPSSTIIIINNNINHNHNHNHNHHHHHHQPSPPIPSFIIHHPSSARGLKTKHHREQFLSLLLKAPTVYQTSPHDTRFGL